MTAVMRAAAQPAGPRVLRIGVVRGGRVVEERIIKERRDVTVGSNEKNLFVIAHDSVPASYTLFQRARDGYVLNIDRHLSGRIKTPGGATDIAQAYEEAGGARVLPLRLDEDARGKVVIGETAFLFQFVAPPPIPPRPQLPVSVTRGGSWVDWRTTTIAAFSALVHFLALGLIYSDWMDPIVDANIDAQALVESIKSLPPPPPVEEKQPDVADEKKAEDQKPKVEKQPAKRNTPKPKPQKSPEQATQKMTTAEVAALASELDSLDMGILASNTGKAATADVLDTMDTVSTDRIDQAAASGVGVSSGGPGGLKVGSAGGAIEQGAAGPGLKALGTTGKTTESGSGAVAKVAGPQGKASVGGAQVAGNVQGAGRVVARASAGFRACYNSGLANNPDSGGKITLRLQVGAGGEVVSVASNVAGNFSPSVVGCIKRRAQSLRFPPPDGGTAVVTVPIAFVAQ